MATEDIIMIGEGAERLLEDAAAQAAMKAMYDQLHNFIDQQQSDRPEDVMAVTRQLRALRQFKVKLEGFVQKAKQARLELERENTRENKNDVQI